MAALINANMLKDLRKQRRLSQLALAEKSGVGIATIKRIESSSSDHERQNVSAERLAKALEVDVDDLSTDEFKRIVDIGSDVELNLHRHNDMESFHRETEKLARLIERRNRILKR